VVGSVFSFSIIQGRDIQKKKGRLAVSNGDSSRVHVRKAQYK
jgi:hypothetical protein